MHMLGGQGDLRKREKTKKEERDWPGKQEFAVSDLSTLREGVLVRTCVCECVYILFYLAF